MNRDEARNLERQIITLLGDDELGLLRTEESPHVPGLWGVTIQLTSPHDWLALAGAAIHYHPEAPPDDQLPLELRIQALQNDNANLTAERDAFETECDTLQEDVDWEKGTNHDLRAEIAGLRQLLEQGPSPAPIDRWLAEARARSETPPFEQTGHLR